MLLSGFLEITITLGLLPDEDRTAFENDFLQWWGRGLKNMGFNKKKEYAIHP
jgi:hypothetical protein